MAMPASVAMPDNGRFFLPVCTGGISDPWIFLRTNSRAVDGREVRKRLLQLWNQWSRPLGIGSGTCCEYDRKVKNMGDASERRDILLQRLCFHTARSQHQTCLIIKKHHNSILIPNYLPCDKIEERKSK